MSKFKYYFFSSAIIILELVIALTIISYSRKYGIFGNGKIASGDNIADGLLFFWIVSFILFLRLLTQKFRNIRIILLLIQNSFSFFNLIVKDSNINSDYLEIYFAGLVVNLLLYLIDKQIFNSLDSFFEEIESE
ncbi:MAG: hypothetical protein U0V04_09700 [Spirosomataceae bacterium]